MIGTYRNGEGPVVPSWRTPGSPAGGSPHRDLVLPDRLNVRNGRMAPVEPARAGRPSNDRFPDPRSNEIGCYSDWLRSRFEAANLQDATLIQTQQPDAPRMARSWSGSPRIRRRGGGSVA